jgi:predicted nucleic acid-binding Zn ribbon protein
MSRARKEPVELATMIDRIAPAPPAGVDVPPVSLRHWEQAVGSRIARKTSPWRLERGVLFVRVAHSVWANELQLLSNEIKAQLASAGIVVEALRFSVGRIDRPPQARRARRAPRPVQLPSDLQARIDAIDDPDLRRAIAEAAGYCLADRPKARRR